MSRDESGHQKEQAADWSEWLLVRATPSQKPTKQKNEIKLINNQLIVVFTFDDVDAEKWLANHRSRAEVSDDVCVSL